MVNKAIIVGRLGRDPEVKYNQAGTAICNFSVATSNSYKKKSGERVDETEWHNVVAFTRTAEVCAEYLKKGSLVYIEGRIKTSSWEKDGEKKYKTEINVDKMQMLDSKAEKKEDDCPF